MKKFNFNLESLLKIKKMNEEKMLKELSKVTTQINLINKNIESNLFKIKKNSSQTIDFKNYYEKTRFFDAVFNQNKNLKENLKKIYKQLEYHRNNFIESKKQKESIELIKKKQYREYFKSYKKKENLEFEEYYSQLNREE